MKYEKMNTQAEVENFRKTHTLVPYDVKIDKDYLSPFDILDLSVEGKMDNEIMICRGKGEFRGFVDGYAPEELEKNGYATWYDLIREFRDIDLYFDDGITKIADDVNGDGVFDTLPIVHVLLPPTIEEIGAHAFKDCNGLESIIIPEGLKYIRKGAFENCEELASIELPSTIEVIEEDAFLGCHDIEIKINKPEGSVAGAPWRADDVTLIWAK